MRFWIGLLFGLLIGVFVTASYYDFLDSDAEISSQSDDP